MEVYNFNFLYHINAHQCRKSNPKKSGFIHVFPSINLYYSMNQQQNGKKRRDNKREENAKSLDDFPQILFIFIFRQGLPWWFSGKESTHNAGDVGLIPGSGRSPGEGNDNPLQYSCPGNPMDRRAWLATVHRVAKVRLNNNKSLSIQLQ